MILVCIAFVLLINLYMLGSSRLGALINAVAWQGAGLCLLAFLLERHEMQGVLWLFFGLTVLVKVFILPALMRRALRETVVRREVEPLVGYSLSLIIGLVLLGFVLWTVRRIPLPADSPMAVGIALYTICSGLFLVIARNKAITQTIAYLSMENGIYLLGLTLAVGNPVVIETGVLLDVFVGVFVMGILILHINREFDHINTRYLSALKE